MYKQTGGYTYILTNKSRLKKEKELLINNINPEWRDLSKEI